MLKLHSGLKALSGRWGFNKLYATTDPTEPLSLMVGKLGGICRKATALSKPRPPILQSQGSFMISPGIAGLPGSTTSRAGSNFMTSPPEPTELDLEAILHRPLTEDTKEGMIKITNQWNQDRHALCDEVERLRAKIATAKSELNRGQEESTKSNYTVRELRNGISNALEALK